ncbi:hypothetical protein ACIBL6_16475 [Streptomyces sp. NPDC050400]|uniref:hypothetical protein n=1 Tax=Streptomyces sp. NPDC050400 TaxID=3365610 RepID=UPI00378D747E
MDHERACDAVRTAWHALRRDRIDTELAAVPVARLVRGAADGQAVQAAGVRTARDVLDAGAAGLEHMGLSPRSARRAHAGARRLADGIEADLSAHLDADDPGPHTVALLVALHVLLEAGADADRTAHLAGELAADLERLLGDAEPAAGYLSMLRAGTDLRENARYAVTALRSLMAAAEQRKVPARFAQASVDLLRGPDDPGLGLSARADFAHRPGQYYGLLARVVESEGALARP